VTHRPDCVCLTCLTRHRSRPYFLEPDSQGPCCIKLDYWIARSSYDASSRKSSALSAAFTEQTLSLPPLRLPLLARHCFETMSAPRTFATASLRGHEHKFSCLALATAQNAATPIHGDSKILWDPHRRLLPRSSDQAVRWCLGALLKGPLGARLGLRSLGLRLCVLSKNLLVLFSGIRNDRNSTSTNSDESFTQTSGSLATVPYATR
jgi:hypothetical protein